jgi:hypothetical protein
MPALAVLLNAPTEWEKKSFDFAQDITKQLLTLATGIIVVTITFVKDFATHASHTAKGVLAVSWVLYVISVFFGVLALMAMAGHLSSTATPTINSGNTRVLAGLQFLAFTAGLVLTVIAGAMAL